MVTHGTSKQIFAVLQLFRKRKSDVVDLFQFNIMVLRTGLESCIIRTKEVPRVETATIFMNLDWSTRFNLIRGINIDKIIYKDS